MSNYKLIYFNFKGRVEPARYMFELAGVKYEDVRYGATDKEWVDNLKPKLLFGQLPVLEVDGKQLFQSIAIHSYLAEVLGFLPSDCMEKARITMIVEALREMDSTGEQWFFEKDETRKAELNKKLTEVIAPKILSNVEALLKENNGGSGWFVGDKVTLADVIVFNALFDGYPALIGKGQGEYPLDNYPLLKAHGERFHALPQIKKWIETRPFTEM